MEYVESFGQDFTLEFIHDMTLAIGAHFGKGPILVGYDGRTSSLAVCKIVTSALNSAGIDCAIAGLVPTPCLEYAVKRLGYHGGIMITASHNPPQYNGMKPVTSNGVEVSRDDEQSIEQIYIKNKGGMCTHPNRWGTTSTEKEAVQTYLDGITSIVNVKGITAKKFTVVIDAGNGAQVITAPELCDTLGCNTTMINGTIDGTFPGRGSEPTPYNLATLSKTVLETKADLGIAFDGDGDRSIFCDEKGQILTGDRLH